MSDENLRPTHVLTKRAVRWSIETLGGQRVHPTLVPYLYLRAQARAGALATASASSDELLGLIEMPGHPSKPYYFPLTERGVRPGVLLNKFWRAANIPGSWSQASIYRLKVGSWLGDGAGRYVLPDDHVDRARREMLYGTTVSALAMGAYFLRNDGFVLQGEPEAGDVIAGFRTKFDYPESADDEFSQLFTVDDPDEFDFAWFETFDAGLAAFPAGSHV